MDKSNPIPIYRDFILDIKDHYEDKCIDIIIKHNTRHLLNDDKEIQDLLQQYKDKGYSVCTYISGTEDIYETMKRIIENYSNQ